MTAKQAFKSPKRCSGAYSRLGVALLSTAYYGFIELLFLCLRKRKWSSIDLQSALFNLHLKDKPASKRLRQGLGNMSQSYDGNTAELLAGERTQTRSQTAAQSSRTADISAQGSPDEERVPLKLVVKDAVKRWYVPSLNPLQAIRRACKHTFLTVALVSRKRL